MDWIREIEIDDLLTNDTALIKIYCGLDVLVSLWVNLSSMNLFISTKPLIEAKKRYIRKYYDGNNIKSLAAKLGVSERFVYDVMAQTDQKDDRQEKLP
jgi:Mor family transcriptional regulator